MRIENWQIVLAEVVVRHSALPFEWGQSDCFTLPLDVAAALTGNDPRNDDPPSYSDEAGALAELQRHGWATTADAFAAHYEEVHPALARRGDIGIAEYAGAVLGGGCVVLGDRVLVKSDAGTKRLPRSALMRAFKVGW